MTYDPNERRRRLQQRRAAQTASAPALPVKLLTAGVKDVATQRVLRQLESTVNEIRGTADGSPIVTGSTTEEKLASLITALEMVGRIRSETPSAGPGDYPHSSYSAAESERAQWASAAAGASTALGDGRPVHVGVNVRQHGGRYAAAIHVSVSFAERRPGYAGPHHNAYELAPAFSGVADPAAHVLRVRDRVIASVS